MSDRVEKELKFRDIELETLRERLQELEAERVNSPRFEDNWVFDRERELQGVGHVLRLRVDENRCTLTFKGKAEFVDGAKVRPELETEVEDSDQMWAILEALGFQVATRYQKVREEWRLGGVMISLDHTPIGDFAEFEGEGCQTVAQRCGYDPAESEQRSYLRLYRDWRVDHPDAPPEMTFP